VKSFLTSLPGILTGAAGLITAVNVAAAQEQSSEVSRLGKLFDASAIDLGANTCAEGASEIGL
jgi:hypothetical protein